MAIVYKIWNTENSMIYIGSTKTSLCIRWSGHRCYAKKQIRSPLYIDMNRIGIDKFFIEKIEECHDVIAYERELFWIKYYNSFIPNGYNQSNPGNYSSNPNKPYPILSFRATYYQKKVFNELKEHGYSAREVLEIILSKITEPIIIYSKLDNRPLQIDKDFIKTKKRK